MLFDDVGLMLRLVFEVLEHTTSLCTFPIVFRFLRTQGGDAVEFENPLSRVPSAQTFFGAAIRFRFRDPPQGLGHGVIHSTIESAVTTRGREFVGIQDREIVGSKVMFAILIMSLHFFLVGMILKPSTP